MLFILSMSVFVLYGQDSTLNRKYSFGFYNQYNLENSSINAISTHRILHDGFRKGVTSRMNEKLGNVTYGIFSFATTYLTMLWSHEFGHSLRAEQVGGHFNIHNAALPIPYTTMSLPDSISLINQALSVTAGFEVNALNTKSIQNNFISQNGLANEDLALSFANRLMYPLYSSVIVPRDPEDPDVWINTAGDPIHIALPVFKNYSNDQVFMSDSTVNPALVRYYNESSIFALAINLIDPQLYREVAATFGKRKARAPIFIIGNFDNGWTYGTYFNVSPLGYELNLNNYIHLKGKKLRLSLKYGNPFKNYGIGLGWTDVLRTRRIGLSVNMDFWDQDLFGTGVAGEISATFNLLKTIGLYTNIAYKSEGYLIGKQLEEGFNFSFGLVYYAKY